MNAEQYLPFAKSNSSSNPFNISEPREAFKESLLSEEQE